MGSIGGDELHLENPQDVGFNEERIVVSVRMRPLNSKEIARHDVIDWECIDENTIIYRNAVSERSPYPNGYTFDRVFRCDCPTRQVYEEAAKKVVLSVVSGINASIFAYGQTSSGKTYTMCGVTAYTVEDIYEYIHRHKEREFVLKFSAMEIYNEAVRDLLSADGTPLRLLDDPERGTVVDRLTEETLRDLEHLKELLSFCETQRQIGETSLNEASSRSHQIQRLTIESSAREFVGKEKSSTLAASVDFVDLAGSERASQALSAGTRLKEGCHINRSLLTLGTVIRKLSKGRSGHVPYRDSKLTRILQCSLGGNARTAIICTISPARTHVEQSRNTLQFASCAKEVATNAQVNVVMSDKALVKQLQRELQRLEGELRGTKRVSATSDPAELLKEKDLRIQKLENEIRELIQQRDNAQSRLEDLVHVHVDDQASPQWELFDQPPRLHAPLTLSDDDLTSESSGLADRHCLDVGFTRFNSSHSNGYSESNFDDTYLQLPQTPVDQFLSKEISPRISISDMKFVEGDPEEAIQEEKIKRDTEENTEEICKEVRCIEIEDSTTRKAEFNSLSTEEVEAMLAFSLTGNEASIFDALTSSPQKGGKEFGEVQTELDFDQALPLSPEKGDRELREVETNYGIDNELPLSPQKEDKELREVQTDCDVDQALSLSTQKEDKELREVQTECALDQPLSLSTQKEDRELREVQTEGGIDQPSSLPSQEEDKELREVQKKWSLDKAFSLSPDKADKDLRDAQKEYESEQELSLSSQKGDKELWEIQTEYGILEMKLQDVQKTSEGLVHSFPDDASSLSLAGDSSSPRSMKLTRSRSCRANLVTSSASPEQNETTSNVYEREFPGRRTSFQGKVTALIFSPNSSKFSRDDSFVSKQSDELKVHNIGNSSRFSREDSFTSEQSASLDEMKVHNIETPPKEDITSIDTFVSGKKEMTKIDCDEDKVYELEPKITDSEKTVKDVGLDPIDDRTESPSSWSLEFQRQQREIIELWQVCIVSLVHRTYFFLLFKGDPSDSIYMEVEHRRLCFLKERMSQGNNNKMVMEGVADLTPASSMRALRREREMLCKQIQKRLSEEERISLYKKWGIGLNTKQRKQQIACRLWTDTKDMNHIMESASLVARLVGLLEPGQALKEMFGLSFTPQQISRRSYSWKGGMSSFL